MFYIHIEDVGKFWSDLNANLQPTSSLIDVFIVMMAISVVATICIQIGLMVVEAKQRKLWESITNNTQSNVQEDTMVDNNQNMANDKSNHDSKTKRERFESWIARREEKAKRNLRKRSSNELKEIDTQSNEKIAKIDSMIAEFKAEIESLEAEKQQEPRNRTELLKDVRGRHDIELEKIVEANNILRRFGTSVFDRIDRVKLAVRNKALEILGVKSEISELKERIAQLELAVDPTKVPEPQAATQADEEQETEVVKEPMIVLPPRENLFFVPEEPVVSVEATEDLEFRKAVEELLEEADALREKEPVNALEMLRNHPIAKKYSIPAKERYDRTRKAYLRLIS